MIKTNHLIEWIKKRVNPALNTVEEDYATECIQRLREFDEVHSALLKIVEGLEEIESVYLERERNA